MFNATNTETSSNDKNKDGYIFSLIELEGILLVDSRLIAERLGIEHKNFIATIETYKTQAEQAFEVLLFQTVKPQEGSKGGRPIRYVLLTEDQATFFMTLSRNTPEVVQCKIDLVKSSWNNPI